ncbi:ribosomal protein S18-alanine N-acetyltransferase [Microbacterium sp. SLBN-146]|uniref:ribosomal protein S18-alanine N-acetyltransferase n=1 Tax=Microbacterium sp. SLBN-146 TaxID=2768457 RepID=UPI0011506D93|nr:ribosomal protein S18-alanine N-acetyltransferase [Microbacterium sp. SLBN-146]TQJ29680.1 ribosomal-protein-alanine N-acetyltransferase [Microbacterium sp. SLBN-146]
MTIRRATSADLDAIMAIERASFPTDAWSDAMMREELQSPHGYYIVDVLADRTVGYAGLRAAAAAKDADVQTITIADAARGRGRGRALLGALLQEAARRRVREVFLEVRADNPVAQSLYASEGFLEIARRPHYYQPDDVDAVVMKLDLSGWHAHRGAADPRGAEEIRGSEDAGAAEPPHDGGSPQDRALPGTGWCT